MEGSTSGAARSCAGTKGRRYPTRPGASNDRQPATGPPLGRRSGGAEGGERAAVEPEGGPLVHRGGAERPVEADRGLVPVEDRPLDPGQPPAHRLLRQPRQQGPAVAGAPVLRRDVEVFEVDAVDALPGREGEEPDREARQLARLVAVYHEGEDGGRLAEERALEVGLGRLDGVRLLLVDRELDDQAQQLGDVGRGSGAGSAHPSRLAADLFTCVSTTRAATSSSGG